MGFVLQPFLPQHLKWLLPPRFTVFNFFTGKVLSARKATCDSQPSAVKTPPIPTAWSRCLTAALISHSCAARIAPVSVIAWDKALGYRSGVKRGINPGRARKGQSRRSSLPARVIDATVFPGRPRGFSLLELLIVVAIMMALLALYWSPSSGSQQRQIKAECRKNLQKAYLALDIYARESAGKFPEVSGAQRAKEPLSLLVPRYTSDESVLVCPGSKEIEMLPGKTTYSYYMGHAASDAQAVLMSDRQVDTKAKAVGEYAFSKDGKPPGNNHGKLGGNFLFCDGHIEPSPARLEFPLALGKGIVLLNP